MKKHILLFYLAFNIGLESYSQDTSLYKGKCKINLISGISFKQVQLWKIDSARVEFIDDGNLSEVMTHEIRNIVTSQFEISFDSRNRPEMRTYDLIISPSSDTFKGFITSVANDRYLEYIPAGGNRKKQIIYKSFITNQTSLEVANNSSQNITDADNYSIENKTVNTYKPAKKKPYPSAKNGKREKDHIITTKGDTIWCTIIKDNGASIIYDVNHPGNNLRGNIPRSEVKKFYNHKYANLNEFEQYDSLNTAFYQNSDLMITSKNHDLITTLGGASIWCNIINETNTDVYYFIETKGQNPKVRIPKNQIIGYEKNKRLN